MLQRPVQMAAGDFTEVTVAAEGLLASVHRPPLIWFWVLGGSHGYGRRGFVGCMVRLALRGKVVRCSDGTGLDDWFGVVWEGIAVFGWKEFWVGK